LVWSISISPSFSKDQTLFIGSSTGVFRTTDAGEHWALVDSGDAAITAVAVSPAYALDATVFAGNSDGIFQSNDGGDTWIHTSAGLPDVTIWEIAVSPELRSDGTVFAATISDGIFSSVDGGRSWESINKGLMSTNIQSLAVSPNFGTDSILFAGTSAGLFRSTDGGDSWTRLRAGSSDGDIVLTISISPDFAQDQTLFVGTDAEGVLRSTDDGDTWNPANQGLRSSTTRPISWRGPSFQSDWNLVTSMGVTDLALPDNYTDTLQVFIGTTFSGIYRGTALEPGPYFGATRQAALPGEYSLLGWIIFLALVIIPGGLFFGSPPLAQAGCKPQSSETCWNLGRATRGYEVSSRSNSPHFDPHFSG